jgi:DNA replication regulator DPB11
MIRLSGRLTRVKARPLQRNWMPWTWTLTKCKILLTVSILLTVMLIPLTFHADAPAVEQHPKSQPKKLGPAALGRQDTVISPKPPEKKGSIFGLPSEILGGSSSLLLEDHLPDFALRAATTTPSLSRAMLQDGTRTRPGSFTMASEVHQATSSQCSDVQRGRVPSSTSPSPMRPPSLQKGGSSRQSLSPVKIDPEATKALQESITSLLGKRPSPDVEEPPSSAGKAGRAKGVRPRKRVRPQRLKVGLFPVRPGPTLTSYSQVQQGTEVQKVEPPKVQQSSAAATSKTLRLDGAAVYVDPLNPFGRCPDEVAVVESAPPQSQPESIRVMYEDPGQRDEKKRLMNVLKGKSSQNGESLDRLSRRSQRIPGF